MALRRYGKSFYQDQAALSEQSARGVVPVVMRLVEPSSVVDVGCGTGAWLKVFKEQGVALVHGIDGGNVPASELRLEPTEFTHADLTHDLPIEGPFDLAISLEVAEHLDASEADGFVRRLAALAPCVLFSAAIPFQGGTNHVNEQWPSYWAAKFADRGFDVVDAIRPLLWDAPDIETHYVQNTILFASRDRADAIRERARRTGRASAPLDIVHPRIFEKKLRHPTLAGLARRFPSLNIRAQRLLRMRRSSDGSD